MYRRSLYPSTVNIEFENILEDLMSIFLYLCFVVALIVFFSTAVQWRRKREAGETSERLGRAHMGFPGRADTV